MILFDRLYLWFRCISNKKSSFHPRVFDSKERKKHDRCPSFSSSLVFNRGRIDAYRHDSHEYLLYDSCNFWTMNLRGHGRVAFNWRTLIPICGVVFFFHRFDKTERKDGKFEDIRFRYTSRFNICRYFETYTRENNGRTFNDTAFRPRFRFHGYLREKLPLFFAFELRNSRNSRDKIIR